MTPTAQEPSSFFKKEYWQNELQSLGIDATKQPNDFNDKTELEALAEMIKQVYYQDYKTAYGRNESSTQT